MKYRWRDRPAPVAATPYPIGEYTRLARAGLATVARFRHGDQPHRDPVDEVFTEPSIVFTLAGTWQIRSRDESARVDPGMVVAANTGQHFRCDHDELFPRDVTLNIEYREDRLRDLLSSYPAPETDGLLQPGLFARSCLPVTPRLAALRDTLLAETGARETGYRLAVDAAVLNLVVEAHRQAGRPARGLAVRPAAAADRVEAARGYLEEHWTEAIDLARLSQAAALSPFHLSRLFKARFGLSPHRYLVRLRIERAIGLLRTTTLSVTQVCHESGFHSLSHFITTFRRHVGASPARFRRP